MKRYTLSKNLTLFRQARLATSLLVRRSASINRKCILAEYLRSLLERGPDNERSNNMNTLTLTFAEKKAAEAAFRGLPADPHWPANALAIYHGIVAQTQGRNIVEDSELECVLA